MTRVDMVLKIFTLVLFLTVWPCQGVDWTQFRGPNANGVSPETGLVREFPAAGPVILWKRPIGEGFSAVSISRGDLFTADARNEEEYVIKADPATGKDIWRKRIAATFEDSWGNGPRSTPNIFDGLVYILSGDGNLICLNRADGNIKWSQDLKKEFGVEPPQWGFSASPFVMGERVIVEVGATGNRSVVAFHKDTSKVLWSSGEGGSAYGSPAVFGIDQKTQLVFLNQKGLIALNPDGELLWQFAWKEGGIKPATPVFVPPDLVVASAAYGTGAAAVRIRHESNSFTVEEVWQDQKLLRNHFSSSLTLDGYLYGFDNATLKCIDPKTGTQLWAKRGGLGKGSLITADGMLIVLTETGTLKLVKASPDAYHELASAKLFNDRSWTAPSLAHGLLYLRDREQMMCLDLRIRAGSKEEQSKPSSP